MDYGRIVYNKGAVDIIFEAGYRLWLPGGLTSEEIKNSLKDLHDFSVHISVFPANASEGQSSLAKIAYGLNSAVPIITDFLLADYQDALRGNVSRVDLGEKSSPRYIYPETLFGWETLKGAKVGLRRFEEGRIFPRSVSWDTRINSETGESWFFSVSEWMNNVDFIRDLRGQDLGEFSCSYPVRFCVKRPGEKRQWFSTSSRDDKPYR